MRSSTLLLVIAAVAASGFSGMSASARPALFAKAKSAKSGPAPALITKQVKLSPDGIKFGMSVEELSKLYEQEFDKEFVPLYQSVEPGPRMNELDSELADKKQLILRNKLDFGSIPSGLDNTPFAGEFTYNNNESVTHVKLRSGIERYFFFFSNRMWKIYDVHKLGPKSKLGATYDDVVATLTKDFAKPPRVRKADSAEGVHLDQVDWENKDTIIRLIDRGGGSAGLLYVDRKIEDNIGKFRSNKASTNEGVDAVVSEATRLDKGPPPDGVTTKKK